MCSFKWSSVVADMPSKMIFDGNAQVHLYHAWLNQSDTIVGILSEVNIYVGMYTYTRVHEDIDMLLSLSINTLCSLLYICIYFNHGSAWLSSSVKFVITVIWEMFVVKIFSWGKWNTKLNTRIFVHNIHFMFLVIIGCHAPWKFFNTIVLHTEKFDTNFSQIKVNYFIIVLPPHLCIQMSSSIQTQTSQWNRWTLSDYFIA